MTAPRRRWLRFSLRMMFLAMTALAVLSGWFFSQMRIIHERQLMMERIEAKPHTSTYTYDPTNPDQQVPYASWARRWLGDGPAIETILVPEATFNEEEIRQIAAAFSEARIETFQPRSKIGLHIGAASMFVIGSDAVPAKWPPPELLQNDAQADLP